MQQSQLVARQHEAHTYLVRRVGLPAGPQIVLVHGIGVASTYYSRLARVLGASAGVHVLELPGFGRAPKPAAPLTVEQLAAVVNGYVRSAGLGRAVLVGHSMGAQVVVEAALQAPEHASRVVAMGCVVDPAARSALAQGLRLVHDFVLETPAANWAVLRDYLRTGPRWYFRTVPHMLAYRTEEAVVRLPVPLLVVRGARDPIAGHAWAAQLSRLSPQARLVEIPRSAHVVMFTRPAEVAAAILAHGAESAGVAPQRADSADGAERTSAGTCWDET